MGAFLIASGGIAIIAGGTWLMVRINRADQRKIERLREKWEAGDKEKPWTWGINWGNSGGGG